MLSYQHIYHAGNAADVHKHLWLMAALEALAARPEPFFWLDAHAGRGLYDLTSPEAGKLGEYLQGVVKFRDGLGRRQDASATARRYLRLVAELNRRRAGLYPGSAYIAARLLRPGDRLLACELHKGEVEHLKAALKPFAAARAEKRDGYQALAAGPPAGFACGGALIDPSYEVKDEYEQVPQAVRAALAAWPRGVFLVWYPLLPAGRHEALLTAFDALRAEGAAVMVDEEHFRAPSAGGGMYGSGMVLVNPPKGVGRRDGWQTIGAVR